MAKDEEYYKYGVGYRRKGLSEVELHLQAFLLEDGNVREGWLGRPEHYWRAVEIMFGKKSPAYFERNPWGEKFVEEACRQRYLAVLGCANSTKSDSGAMWGLINWLAAPLETMVMVTSTSLKDSRKRVWGRVVHYYSHCPGLPGRLVDSLGIIRTDDGSKVFIDNRGISLIAGEKKKEKEAIGKMIGMKQKRMFMIADELPELSEAILEAAFSNLANNPYFQLIGIGNFNSIYDSLGVLARPKKGYGSVTPEDEEWETERGYCIRFDGLKSPNLLTGEEKWPFLYNKRNLRNHRAVYGENSAALWRMCRSFPCPIGNDNVIYSESDLIAGKAEETECIWRTEPVTVAAMDPSFTSGGDRAPMMIGKYGLCTDDVWRLKLEKIILLTENVNVKEPRDYQIARLFRNHCHGNNILPENAAMDTTAAGSVLWSIVAEEWDRRVLAVNFSGAASDLYVRANDLNKGKTLFDRRVSELWWVGREFMKYGQLRGIDPDTARELKARQYTTIKGPEGLKVSVEKKEDMKKRLGFSPDLGDCYAILIELCRQRFGFLAGGVSTGQNKEDEAWTNLVESVNNLYEHVDYSEQPIFT